MIYNTSIFSVGFSERKNYAAMLLALWPTLQWRHTGIGALQAYIKEGDTDELRLHIWSPSLVKHGIEDSGLCHDHRFNLRSTILVGAMTQTEFEIKENDYGTYEIYTVTHAKEAMKQEGSFHKDPVKTNQHYNRSGTNFFIPEGHGYTFKKFAFHESRASELTITLLEKTEQENTRARILKPVGIPLIHAFTETQTYEQFKPILAQAREALAAI